MKLTLAKTLQLIAQYIATERHLEAADLCRKTLEAVPYHPRANFLLGKALAAQGKPSESLVYFENAIRENPKDEEHWYEFLAANHRITEREFFSRPIQFSRSLNGNTKIEFLLELAYGNLHDGALNPVIEPDEHRLNSILQLIELKKLDAAEEEACSLITMYPKSETIWKLLTNIYRSNSRSACCLLCVKVVSEICSKTQSNISAIAGVYKELELFEIAEHYYREALEFNPLDINVRVNLGVVFKTLKKLNDAVECLTRACEIDDRNYVARFNLANTYYEKEEFDLAETNYLRALELKPDFAHAHSNLANLYVAVSKLDDAEKHFQLAIESDTANPQLYSNFAEFLISQFDSVGAESIIRQALKSGLVGQGLFLSLGRSLSVQGRRVEAITCIKEEMSRYPDSSASKRELSLVYMLDGQLESAKAMVLDYLQLFPRDREALFILANIFAKSGSYSKAESVYSQLSELSEKAVKAELYKANLHMEYGDLDAAEACFNKVICDLALEPFPESYKKSLRGNEASVDHREILLKAKFGLCALQELRGRTDRAVMECQKLTAEFEPVINKSKKREIIGLIPFGRAGSLFVQSLFDGHPDLITLPGVYFKGWYSHRLWQMIQPDYRYVDWRQRLSTKIIDLFEPFFDARSRRNVPGKPMGDTNSVAAVQGFTRLGEGQNTAFEVDKDKFTAALVSYLMDYEQVDRRDCFEALHSAYALETANSFYKGEKCETRLLYHIHNPNIYEQVNYLNYHPDSKTLVVFREPIQSMESWMLISDLPAELITHKRDLSAAECDLVIKLWNKQVDKIEAMFRLITNPLNGDSTCKGIRLEDIKNKPKEAISGLCDWIGIPEHAALYESTFKSYKYWGPNSTQTGLTTGFDKRAINKPKGRIFGDRDIVLFETLLWPVYRRYEYEIFSDRTFNENLSKLPSWIEEPLEFEKRYFVFIKPVVACIEQIPPYRRLHRILRTYLSLLEKEKDYPGIADPLVLCQ